MDLGFRLGFSGVSSAGTSPGPVNTVAPAVTGSATRGNTLTCSSGTWTSIDDPTPPTFTYQWQRDGVDISGATSSTYDTVEADDGTLVRCVVTATDSNTDSRSANSNTTRILGEAVNHTVPSITGTVTVGETITTDNEASYWYAATTLSFTYQWQRDGANISGATSSSYTLVSADYNTSITCEITGDSSAFVGTGETVETPGTAAVVGLAPSNSVAPVISAAGTSIGDTITLTDNGTWAGPPAPSLASRQWQRDSVDIPGETGTTYTIAAADDNASITCDVTFSNIYGSTEESSNAVSVDDFAAPDFGANTPSISGTAQVGETLTVTPATESTTGVPSTTTNYVWRYVSDNTVLQSSSSTTYVIQAEDEGEQIDVEQTNTNAIGSDSATSSATDAITSTFTPDNLSNKHAWYDFSDNSSVTTAGGTVTAVTDQFGLNNGTGLGNPQHTSSSHVSFDGTDDGIQVPATSTTTNVFVVVKTTDTQWMVIGSNDNNDYAGAIESGSASSPDSDAGTVTYRVDGAVQSSPTRGDLFTAICDDSKHIVAALNIGGGLSSRALEIGEYPFGSGTFDLNGSVYEIVVTTGTISTGDRDNLESYLATKHSITI